MTKPAVVGVLVLGIIVSCGSNGPESSKVLDSGTVCLIADLTTISQRFDPSEKVLIYFALKDVCLSTSCDLDRVTSCTVARDNNGSFTIATSASWRSYTDRDCTVDCGHVDAWCETEPLANGVYSFSFGESRLDLVVPSELTQSPCVNSP